MILGDFSLWESGLEGLFELTQLMCSIILLFLLTRVFLLYFITFIGGS